MRKDALGVPVVSAGELFAERLARTDPAHARHYCKHGRYKGITTVCTLCEEESP